MLLCHDVYFTLKDRSPAAVDALIAACKEYLTVQPGIKYFCCGKRDPGLERDVNDREFDVALHIVFTDRAAHDAYQDDATHNRFIAEMRQNWSKVRVFDSLVERV
ncbi:MAG TPA: Dabb family protein [Gemmataceae bacterium]|nr:Dabb family protein [Gemmataceae bacterium]